MTKPDQTRFQRIETKYLVTAQMAERLQEEFKQHMEADAYAYSTITNIYFDSPEFQMIEDSKSRLHGREKIRMRTYDARPHQESQVFLEIKKNEGEVGHKYRTKSTIQRVLQAVADRQTAGALADAKVESELDLLKARYGHIQPMMYIYYHRLSLKGLEDSKVRVTFDSNVLFRQDNVSLTAGNYGTPLVDPDQRIMEIKVPGQYPAWLAAILDKYGLVNQPFSKYLTAYTKTQEQLEVVSA